MTTQYRLHADSEGYGYTVVGPSVWLFPDVGQAIAFAVALERLEAEIAWEARKSVALSRALSPAPEFPCSLQHLIR